MHTGSESRIKQSVKSAGCGLEVPSNILSCLGRNGFGTRSEELVVQLLNTGFISAQGTFHMGYPSIQCYSKILDVPSGVRSNNFTAYNAGSSNGFISNNGRIGPGI